MTKFKLEHNRPDCIGCAACAAIAPEYWEMHEDGKSDIKKSIKRPDGWEEREIEETEFTANKDAADACPVNVIHIRNLQTNEKII